MPHGQNQSALSRIGKGLVSFGTGIPQIELDRQATENEFNDVQIRRLEQEIASDQRAAIKEQQLLRLSSSAFDPDNKNKDADLLQLSLLDPDFTAKVKKGLRIDTQEGLESAARRAAEIFAQPTKELRDQVIDRQVAENPDLDLSETLQMKAMSFEAMDGPLRVVMTAGLTTAQRQTASTAAERGVDVPAGQREFEALIEDMSPEDQIKAREIKAGLEARAGSSSTERIALDKALTDLVASSQAQIAGAKSFATATGSSRAKFIDTAFETVQKIDGNIRNLDEAIAAIDGGASTGAIESRFIPTIRESTVLLERIQKELALDVINSATFGPLSQKELDLALKTAMPLNLDPPALRQWIVNKQAAQMQQRDYFVKQMEFLSPPNNGTIAGWVREMESIKKGREKTAQPQTIGRFQIETVDG